MSKVIQNIQGKLTPLTHRFSSLLHRGQKSSSDPYNEKKLNFGPTRLLQKTLGTSRPNTRCSSTFQNTANVNTYNNIYNNNHSQLNSYITKSKYTRVAGISSACIFTLLFALFLYPIIRNLNSAEAITPTDSTTTLTIASGASANVELLVRDSAGTFAKSSSSEAVSFGVTTNNYAGYELSIAGSDNTYNNLVNSNTSTNLTSISSSMDESSFSSYSLTGNQGIWGYLPSKLDSSANTSYQPAPDTTGDTIEKTTTPNASTANNYTIGLGVKANYSTPAGTYSNTYVLTAVGNGTPYTITYADNSGDSTVSGLPSTQQSTEGVSTSTVELTTDTPTRTGYSFTSWCEGTVSNSGTTCTGTTYAPGASFGIDRTAATNASTLYAVWTINKYNLALTFAGSGVENVKVCATSGNCTGTNLIGTVSTSGGSVSNLPYNTTYYLYPTFSSNYELDSWAKTSTTGTLSSTSDLNPTFTIGAGNGAVTITGKSTIDTLQDFTSAECVAMATNETKTLGDSRDGQAYTIAKLADGNCWMDNLNLGATDLTTDLTSDNTNLSTTITASTWNGYKKTSGSGTYTAAEYIPVSGTDSTSGTAYGTLYNYCAASAGTICSSSNSSNATYDICPKGWRLPTGGDSGEFYTLYNNSSYNSNALMRASIANGGAAFALAGSFSSGTPTNQGSSGHYWSSTWYNNTTTMSYLYLNTSAVYPAYSVNRFYGFSIRCVKDIPTLQDFTYTESQAMSTGDTKTLYDSRDEQAYTIQKLADGNVWMMENLNLGATNLTTDLTSDNTNFTGTISASTWNGYKKTSGSSTYTAAEYIPLSGTDSTSGTAYGTLYNYCAASAGTYCYDSSTTGPSNAAYDICPKGWRLPTGGSSGEFKTLYNNSSYNSAAKMRASVANGGAAFALAGSFSSSTPASQGSSGRYWSSTRSSNTYMRLLYLVGTGYVEDSYNFRYAGYSIRCVLAPTMQDFTASDVAAMSTGDTTTLRDSRDGQFYTVAKLGDGNVWMTRNLAIGCAGSGSSYSDSISSTTLTSSDSNVSSSYTTPTSAASSWTDGGIVCNSTYGAWYNYYAASAGTISGDSSTTTASKDICPKGWRLPTYSEISGITSYVDAFSPVTGGYYLSGSFSDTEDGRWWSATAMARLKTSRYSLRYNGSSLDTPTIGRLAGLYVRCIRSS